MGKTPRKTVALIRVYDSALGEEYPKHRLYAVAYEPIWQSLRTSLSWVQNDQAALAYARCMAYVNLGKGPEVANRTWRVFNLLCAIPHGQVTKKEIHMVEPGASKFLLRAQDEFRERLQHTGYPVEWDWHVTRVAAIQMFSNDPQSLVRIVKPLVRNRAMRADAKPELRHYLTMMEEIMGDMYPGRKV